MYLDRSGLIVEGFLGQQNPTMGFRLQNNDIVFFVKGDLTGVKMYKPGQFGVDIYAPISDLSTFILSMELDCVVHTREEILLQSYDPTGKERGKTVPRIEKNWGRVLFGYAECRLPDGTWMYSKGGYVYMDLETHDGTNHKIWAENNVMEPFEYHLGFRGRRAREDPFYGARDSNLLLDDEWFAVKIPRNSIQSMYSVLSNALISMDYQITEVDPGHFSFQCTVDSQRRRVTKRYQKIW